MYLKQQLLSYLKTGWLFFIPYLSLYITAWYFEINKGILLKSYYFLHIFHLLGYSYLIYINFNNLNLRQLLFWVSIATFFFVPGAYLEYPSDALEHVRRIFQWEHLHKVHDGIAHYKFSYFWTYSLISFTEPVNYKTFLDVYYSFIGLILTFQFYKLGKKTIKSDLWTKVSLVILIITYGNSSFSFYRYYALSSTMLCLVGFLVFLNALISYNTKYKNKSILFMFLGFILAVFNHPQSVLLVFSSCVSFYCYSICLKRGNPSGLYYILKVGIFIFIISFLCYITILGNEFHQVIEKINSSNNWLYPWGGFKILSTNLDYTGPKRFLQILGLLGILNLFFAILLLRKNELLAWISIAPVLLLLYPPFSIALAYTLEKWSTIINYHRILLVIPSGFCIVMTFKMVSETNYIKEIVPKKNLSSSLLVLVILMSLVPNPLIYGRLINLLDSSFNNNNIEKLHITSNIIKNKLELDFDSIILSDSTTQFYVSAHLGLKVAGKRRGWEKAESINDRIKKAGGIPSISNNKKIKAILCVNHDLNLTYHSSVLGTSTGHWRENFINESLVYDQSTHKDLDQLLKLGWKKSKIEPWYDLYIP